MRISKKELRRDLYFIISGIIGVLILGGVVFHLLEDWSYVDAFYFVTMTATTVGYGDLTPTTTLTKVITIAYSLSIIPFVLYAFSFIAKSQATKVYAKIHHLERKQKEQEEEIDSTERKINYQKGIINKQKEEIEEQEGHIKKGLSAIKKTTKELESQKERLKEEHNINKRQEQELEVVEKIMEEALVK